MFIAVGLFASALTGHQLVAALVGTAILAGGGHHDATGRRLRRGAVERLVAAKLNTMTYFRDFSRGVLDTRGVVFFLSATALFLFLSVKALESRRWR